MIFDNARPSSTNRDGNHPTRDLPQLFPDISSRDVNSYLSDIVPGLSAKVFRTHHATVAVKQSLDESEVTADSPEYQKREAAALANMAAAVLCNHTKKGPANWSARRERMKERRANAQARVDKYREQVREYRLPRTPVKDTDLRKAGFEMAYGEGQTELDALEALRPGELARIVRGWALRYVDPDLFKNARRTKDELQAALDDAAADALDTDTGWLRDQVKLALANMQEEWAGLQGEWDEFVAPFQEKVDAYEDRLRSIKSWGQLVDGQLEDDIEEACEGLEDDYPLPEPDLPTEQDEQLYNSQLDYGQQLSRYKAYRHGW